MKTRVRVRVRVAGDWVWVKDNCARSRVTVARQFGKCPTKSYRVEYRLSPKGQYYYAPFTGLNGFSMNCVLPMSWRGQCITRKVLPW